MQSKACPHCGKQVFVSVGIDVELEIKDDTPQGGDWRAGLTEDQIAFVESARSKGILDAFQTAVRRAKEGHIPRHIETFLLTFLRTMQPRVIPGWALDHFIRENNGGRISFYSAQGVGLVTADGQIRQFLPLDLVVGRRAKGAQKARISADPREFEVWVRTRFGYVPAECKETLSVMQKRSAGEFAHPRI